MSYSLAWSLACCWWWCQKLCQSQRIWHLFGIYVVVVGLVAQAFQFFSGTGVYRSTGFGSHVGDLRWTCTLWQGLSDVDRWRVPWVWLLSLLMILVDSCLIWIDCFLCGSAIFWHLSSFEGHNYCCVIIECAQRTHDAKITSLLHQNDIIKTLLLRLK